MNDALLITALGMGIVFLVLMIICAMIFAMGSIFTKKAPEAPAKVAAPAAQPAIASAVNDEEIVAAIMGAVSAYMGGSNFKIHSITPLVVRPMVRNSEVSPWSAAGISENNHR